MNRSRRPFALRVRALFVGPLPACLACLLLAVSACASTPAERSTGGGPPETPQRPALSGPTSGKPAPAVCWLPLIQRLQADGLDGSDIVLGFACLGENLSQAPMGAKITELFKREFMKPPRPPQEKPKDARPVIYPNIVTQANVERCRNFLSLNPVAFATAAQLYGVPGELVVSLLFVETRLGAYLGKDNAFMTLASMASSTTPEHIPDALAALPMTPERLKWVELRLKQRADWAYNELKALIIHARANKLDLLTIPGSMYGAVGLCQFMPSNFKRYAADGNGDGVIDLFDPADAIMSAGNYLYAHGWKKTLDRNGRHAVLMRYNKSVVYANTILALADAVNPPPAKGKIAAKKGSTVGKKSPVPAKAKAAPTAKAQPRAVPAQQNADPAKLRPAAAP